MSDDRPMRVSGGAALPELISLDEMARAAGRQDPLSSANADIEALGQQVLGFIDTLPANHGAMMARSKLSELLHWMRASRASRVV